MRIRNFLAVALLMISPAFSQEVAVTGAEKPVEVGSLIVLNASLKTKPDGLLDVKYSWFRIENNTLVRDKTVISPDSTKLYSGTGGRAGTLNFVVLPTIKVTSSDGVNIQVPTTGTNVAVKIIDSGPPVPPDNPTPTPRPNLPAGQFGFAQKFAEIIYDDATMTVSNKVNLAKSLSSNFKNVIVRVTAPGGDYRNFSQILKDTAVVNDVAFHLVGITDKNAPIRANFNKIVSQAYNNGAGKLNNTDALVTAWTEAAQGFDWIANNLK